MNNTGTVPLDEIRKAIKTFHLHGYEKAFSIAQADYWLRSLIEEVEKWKAATKEEFSNRYAAENQFKLAREELEQVKKERDEEAEKKREAYRNLNDWQHCVYALEEQLNAKNSVLESLSKLTQLPSISDYAIRVFGKDVRSILSRYKEAETSET